MIDPLFIDELNAEADAIISAPASRSRTQKLRVLQRKLAGLKFLDPACGFGNFLTESYLSLCRLENRIIKALAESSYTPPKDEALIKVSISQFYGIEINDFAVAVARTALWIAESQMWNETQRMNEAQRLIPFLGDFIQNGDQKKDVQAQGQLDGIGQLYACCCMRVVFVSMNSIAQSEQVTYVFKMLNERFRIGIDFAYQTFVWNSEATDQAHVHVVVIGFDTIKEEGRLRNSTL